MDFSIFKQELRGIYASHGKAAPASDAVITAVWKRIQSFPDDFMRWSATQLADYEKLPNNLGLELERSLFPDWKAQTGFRTAAQALCPNCDREFPGFFMAFEKTPAGYLHSFLVRCPCNHGSRWEHMESYNKAEAQRRGYTVKQHGQSLVNLERRLLGKEEKTGQDVNPEFGRLAQTMPGVKPRKRHLDYVAGMEEV